MALTFEDVSIEEVRAKLSRRTRTSKWRENIEEFMQRDVPAVRLAADDGEEFKPGSIASGLNNALKSAKDSGSPYPIAVKQSTASDGTKSVYLIRTDLVGPAADAAASDDDE